MKTTETISFDKSNLKKRFLETGSNMLKVVYGNNGVDLESYNELFPFFESGGELITSDMWDRLFQPALSTVGIATRRIANKFSFTEGMVINYDDERIEPLDLDVLTDTISDIFVYSAVAEWFTQVNAEDLIKLASVRVNDELKKLYVIVKKIEAGYLRKTLSPAIFDNMIEE